MSYEQNLTGRRIAVVVLSAIEWHVIRQSLLTIQAALDAAAPGFHQASVASSIGNFHVRKSVRDALVTDETSVRWCVE